MPQVVPAVSAAQQTGAPHRSGTGAVPLLALAVLVWLAGCSDPTGPGDPATVEVTGPGAPLTALGETVELEVAVLDGDGRSVPDPEVEWSSEDADVVSIDAEGTATAQGAGTARVEARAGEASGSLTLTVEPRPDAMDPAQGDGQEGTVGEPLADSVLVEVRDSGGSAVTGEWVRFRVTSGGGTVSPDSVATDAQGRAAAGWTLGVDTSVPQRLEASTAGDGAGGLDAEFEATALPAAPASVSFVHGDGQSGFALEPLEDSLAVRVEDAFANPVPDAEVTWEVEGKGVVEPNPAATDGTGRARGQWTPGDTDGTVEVTARLDGAEPAVAQAHVEPNAVIRGSVRGAGSDIEAAETGREAARWPRVPSSAFADVGTTESTTAEPRTLAALTRSPSVSAEAAPLSGSGDPDTEPRGESHAQSRELLVTLRDGVTSVPGLRAESRRDPERAAALAVELRDRLGELLPGDRFEALGASPVLGTVRIRVHPDEDPDRVRSELLERDAVERVTENRTIEAFEEPPGPRARAGRGPEDPKALRSGGGVRAVEGPLSETGEINPLQLWHYRALDLQRAWEVERGSEEIVVAVVDDGFRFQHPWLQERWVSEGYSFVEEEELDQCEGNGTVSSTGHGEGPGPDATVPVRYRWDGSRRCVMERLQQGGHGMQVAGLIAGTSDGEVRGAGVAPGVSLLPVRALNVAGVGSGYAVAQGILYAAGLPADDGRGGTVQAERPAQIINLSLGSVSADSVIHDAVREAHAAGALLVAAAGNHSSPYTAFPAGHPEVVAVSAIDPAWELTWYSNRGGTIELAAPGGVAEGGPDHFVWTAEWNFDASTPAFGPAQGTSMASPHAAGVAALVWSREPALTHEEVRQRLRDHAFPLGPGTPNSFYGYGLVDAYWSVTDGAGRPMEAHAFLYDAETGEVVEQARSGDNRSFQFSRLDPGRYWVFAGTSDPDVLSPGLPPGPWGAAGTAGRPDTLVVEGSGLHDVSVDLVPPVAGQDNDASDSPDVLPLGGYLAARLHDPDGAHRYRLPVPEAGTYVIETTGVLGACGLVGHLDTALEVLDEDGTVLDRSTAVDEEGGNACSYLELHLEPGEYTVRVASEDGRPGLYRVVAR